MRPCPSCAAPLPQEARFCPVCGAAATKEPAASPTDPAGTPTSLPTEAAPVRPRSAPRHASGADLSPGEIVAGRYRVVGLLGRGGMGEVYRADDLKLGQPVALKFLPRELETDPSFLARFHAEVRAARQVSHAHVCRVHDIGEVNGRHFLTMEYVDGEDLATLLRRIGSLPAAKAIEIARQLCAGLQAVHDGEIVHRDLKPGNVMLDGRGRVRLTDFGLAVSFSEARGEVAGTPAYMAPEQLAGGPVTPRSDLYALGLLLYEVCTGKRPFDAATLAGWRRAHAEEVPVPPGQLVRDLDPAVEKVILRCLEKDPALRPRSAAEVAFALPGADPLAAAIAAGETPPPEVVAAAFADGALRPGSAAACLAGVLLLLAVLSGASGPALYRLTPFERPAEVLADRAHEVLVRAGYTTPAAGRAFGFELDQTYLAWPDDPRPAPARWRRLTAGQPFGYFFWYRQSPVSLEPSSFGANGGRVTRTDPPASIEGMANVTMDVRGRLVELVVVPPAVAAAVPAEAAGAAKREDPWPQLFAAAGLDPARFEPAAARLTPPVFADRRVAWSGSYADHPDLTIRIEAASLAGRAVFFRISPPWDEPPARAPAGLERSQLAALLIVAGVLSSTLVGAVFLTRWNLRLGRGDRKGAIRVASAAGALAATGNLLHADLVPTLSGAFGTLVTMTQAGLTMMAVLWLCYLALEPTVRRRSPGLLVSWSRLLDGRLGDPLVGRDVLVGTLLGIGTSLAWCGSGWLKVWSAHPLGPNRYLFPGTLDGPRRALSALLWEGNRSLVATFAILVFLVLARRLVRGERAAAVALWGAFSAAEILAWNRSWPTILATLLSYGLLVGVVSRMGLVAGVACGLAGGVSRSFPLTLDTSAPYAGSGFVAAVAVAALAVYGYRVSLGSRRVEAGTPDD